MKSNCRNCGKPLYAPSSKALGLCIRCQMMTPRKEENEAQRLEA